MDLNFKYLLASLMKNRGYVKHGGDLTTEDLQDIWNDQNGICPITGVRLIVPTWGNYKLNSLYRASIDRKDNNAGYFKPNVRFVSQMYNFARNTNSNENVVLFCRLVVENLDNEHRSE